MTSRMTQFAIVAAVIGAIVIAYLVSRPRVPAGTGAAPSTTPGGGTTPNGQRTDESRAATIVGAGLGAAGDVVGALA